MPDPPAQSSDSASTDTTSFAPIWSGSDPRKHAEICEALDRQEIPARTLRREDHLFNPTAHAPFEVYVPVQLMTTAREAINEADPPEDDSEEISESDSHEIPAEDDQAIGDGYDDDGPGLPLNVDPEEATDEIWTGEDADMADMIKSSLRENHIPYRSDSDTEPKSASDEMRATRLLVFPEDKDRARAIVQQILDAAPPG